MQGGAGDTAVSAERPAQDGTTDSGATPARDGGSISLVAYYPFNGNATDESGNGNDGAVNGATFARDRFNNENQSLLFNGISDNVLIRQSQSLDLVSAMSICAWVKPVDFARYRTIVGAKDSISGTWEFLLDLHAPEFHYVNLTDINSSGSVGVADANWHQVAVVRNGYEGNWQYLFYVDGKLDGDATSSGDLVDRATDTQIGLGRSNGYPFSGQIDDVRIYRGALSPGEIDALYHEGGWTRP
jgi:hypothetical protein